MNAWKITKGVLKGSVGAATFASGVVLNSLAKAATGGFSLPNYDGNPVTEAKELSKF